MSKNPKQFRLFRVENFVENDGNLPVFLISSPFHPIFSRKNKGKKFPPNHKNHGFLLIFSPPQGTFAI
jgi:hypothetical protein